MKTTATKTAKIAEQSKKESVAEVQEKTAYQQLLEKLDDQDFARKFFDEKQAEAGELIDAILSVTLGWNVVTKDGDEWGHRNLFKILELFTIRHENFDRAQLAENLQIHIFHFTMKHDKTYREWKKGWEVEDTLAEEITELTQETKEKQNISDSPECAELNILANQLSSIMKNDLMPTRLFNVIADELNEVPSDWRTPENVLFNLEEMRRKESDE